jgi:hypothetical protein
MGGLSFCLGSCGFSDRLGVQSECLLMIDLGCHEQNLPFVAFFRHFVLLLFASVVFFFLILRFEPNVLFALFGS